MANERETIFKLLNSDRDQVMPYLVQTLAIDRAPFNVACCALADAFIGMRELHGIEPWTDSDRLTAILKFPKQLMHMQIDAESDPIPLAYALIGEIQIFAYVGYVFEDKEVFADAFSRHTTAKSKTRQLLKIPASSLIRRSGKTQAENFTRAGGRWSGIR